MKTYWDYTDRERADLTEKAVSHLCAVALMEAGIAEAVDPGPAPEPPTTGLTTTPTHVISVGYSCDLVFDDLADAEAFLALQPRRVSYDYKVGSQYCYAEPVELTIETKNLYRLDEINGVRSQLEAHEAAKDTHRRKQEAYRKQQEAISKATADIWSDWHEQQDTLATCKFIQATFRRYLELTEGDAVMARRFLVNTHGETAVVRAEEWLGLTFVPTEGV